MCRYIIERDIPGAASMSEDELWEAARKSVQALRDLGPDVQWVQSHITDDRVYCEYLAESEQMMRDHARRAGVPATKVSLLVTRVIDPPMAGAGAR